MKLIPVLAAVLLWTTPVLAETYSWIDDNGTYNFTEDYSRVPEKYRSKLDKRDDPVASPVSKETVPQPTVPGLAPPAASKKPDNGAPGTAAGSSGDKGYEQWKQEFGEREAAMRAIRKRVDEIDAHLDKNSSDTEQTRSLIAERNKAVEQFTEMRRQYDQQVELARKAGFQVDIVR